MNIWIEVSDGKRRCSLSKCSSKKRLIAVRTTFSPKSENLSVILLCAVLLLMLILLRGASLALHTRKAFHSSLALQAILLLGLRALFYLLSLSGLVPFSSGQFPFLSDALPDLLAQFFLLGILSGVSARNEADLEEDTRLSMLAR